WKGARRGRMAGRASLDDSLIDQPPDALAEATMSWDPQGAQLFIFGGTDDTTDFRDVYRLDPTATPFGWHRSTPVGPGARYGHAAASVTGRGVIIFGGERSHGAMPQHFNDTWQGGGAAWTQLTNAGTPPSARFDHSMGPADTRLVIFGGQTQSAVTGETWLGTLSGNTVTWAAGPTGPPARRGASFVYDTKRGLGVLWGGRASGADPTPMTDV